jgi:hypothetical protein
LPGEDEEEPAGAVGSGKESKTAPQKETTNVHEDEEEEGEDQD